MWWPHSLIYYCQTDKFGLLRLIFCRCLKAQAGFSIGAFKRGPQGLPMWSKGVLDYDLGVCFFKEVKKTAKILTILTFKPEIRKKYESIDE